MGRCSNVNDCLAVFLTMSPVFFSFFFFLLAFLLVRWDFAACDGEVAVKGLSIASALGLTYRPLAQLRT